jgi:hypothetical protein
VCGRRRRAAIARRRARLRAIVRIRDARRSRAALYVARCERGRWRAAKRITISPAHGRHVFRLPTAARGGFRAWVGVRRHARLAKSRRRYYVVRRRTPGRPHVTQPRGAVDVPVSFRVENRDTSAVACASDGAAYTVRGHLSGPKAALSGPRAGAVTVYLHGLDVGSWFWRFSAVDGYDFAAKLAAAGQVSLVVDRLGYDASDHPAGSDVCVGSQADMAHQIITQLRRGSYRAAGGRSPAFSKVVLAGHSIAGAIAQVEAYSYKDVAGLMVLSWSDTGSTQEARQAFLAAGTRCAAGGRHAEHGGPGGYEYFGPTEQDFRAEFFHSARPEVVAAATPLRNLNPCGDLDSLPAAIAVDQARVRDISVPVLVLSGKDDVVFSADGVRQQSEMFTGSPDVTLRLLDNTAHALTLEATAPRLRAEVIGWLRKRGL